MAPYYLPVRTSIGLIFAVVIAFIGQRDRWIGDPMRTGRSGALGLLLFMGCGPDLCLCLKLLRDGLIQPKIWPVGEFKKLHLKADPLRCPYIYLSLLIIVGVRNAVVVTLVA